jgi:hypothetical protein
VPFVKLDCGILDSSLWSESSDTIKVWLTMLAMAGPDGVVPATAPGISKEARLPLETVVAALEVFEGPDAHSRTLDHEGRRIKRVDGGYLVLNYGKYREKDHGAAERARNWRESRKSNNYGERTPYRTAANGCERKTEDRRQKTDVEDIQQTQKPEPKRRSPRRSELERLLAEPEIRTLAEVWSENLGGGLTLGVASAVQKCLAAGYTTDIAVDAIMAIRTARTNPERYPERSFARWCEGHNSKPEYVLRAGNVEELAVQYQRYGQSPKPVPVSVPHKRITDRTDEPAPDDVFKAIQERNRKALGQ